MWIAALCLSSGIPILEKQITMTKLGMVSHTESRIYIPSSMEKADKISAWQSLRLTYDQIPDI